MKYIQNIVWHFIGVIISCVSFYLLAASAAVETTLGRLLMFFNASVFLFNLAMIFVNYRHLDPNENEAEEKTKT